MEHDVRPTTIGLVEDDLMLVELVALSVESRGDMRLGWTAGNVASIRGVATTPVDVVVLDLNLPDGDGPEQAAAVRAACPDAHVVIFAADVALRTAALSRDLEVSRVLDKAMGVRRLLQVVSELSSPRPVAGVSA